MNEAQFVIYLMSKDPTLLLADAQAEAAKVYGSTTTVPTKSNVSPEALKMAKVELGWDDQIVDHEIESQEATYPGQIRRIRRIVQEKLRARKFFDRAKMYM